MSGDHAFDYDLGDGRTAHCWQACDQPYADCVISAGLVEGIDPDVIYLNLKRGTENESWILFLREDEAMAILHVLSGALWSREMIYSAADGEGGDAPDDMTTVVENDGTLVIDTSSPLAFTAQATPVWSEVGA